MLDRYRKKGGFVQLLVLIESSGRQKQDQFLSLIAQESPIWENAIRSKCLSLDKILSWGESHLREVLSRIQPLTLATALSGMPREKTEKILNCLSAAEQRKIQQVIDESRATPAEVNTCVLKIIAETRSLAQGGLIKLEKIDAMMVIPENYEESLSNEEAIPGHFLQRNMSSSELSGDSHSQAALNHGLGAGGAKPKVSEKSLVKAPPGIVVSSATHPAPISKSSENLETKAVMRHDALKDENEFLRKKVNQLTSENASLKQEVAQLRGKLDQIRKIA